MPFRIVGYDGAAYRSQLQQERKKMLPVMTIVLYFGTDRHWNSRKKIKELMEIPRCLDTYVNDYQMHVFEVAWLTEEQISHFHSDFKVVANFFVQKNVQKTVSLYLRWDTGPADLQKKIRHLNLNRIWSLPDCHLNRKLPERFYLRNLHRCVFLSQTVSVLKYLIPADRN